MVVSRHLKKQKALEAATIRTLANARKGQGHYHSSGWKYVEASVEKGFLHWKVVE